MKKKWMNVYSDENGNIALFVLGMLSIMMVLFILVINLSSVLAVKQDSETTVSQASLAATSAFYEEVRTTILGHSYPEPTPPTPPDDDADESARDEYDERVEEYEEEMKVYEFFTFFDDRLDDAKSGLTGIWYNDWSDNELDLEALDVVLEDALTDGGLLQEVVEGLLEGNSAIHEATTNMAILAIEKNGGVIEEATLDIEDDRITIKAANEVTSTSYDGIMNDITEKVFQESAGPKIGFIELIWKKPTPVLLEYE